MKELYKYKDRVLLYDTETKEVKELDKKTARKILDSRAKMLDGRYDNYYGEEEANKYGAKIIQALRGKTITKRRDKSNQPGGLEYEAKKLGIDVWDFLRALEGLCYQGKAEETSDSTYRIKDSIVKDILEIYDDTLIIVTDEKNRVVYKGIVDYAPKEIRDGRWRKGANNKTFTIDTERGVLTVKVLDSSVRDSVVISDSSLDEVIRYSKDLKDLDTRSDEQTIRSLIMKGESIAKQVERSIEGLSREYKSRLQTINAKNITEYIENQYFKTRRAVKSVQTALEDIMNFFRVEIKGVLTKYSNGRPVGERFPGKTDKYLAVAQRLESRFREIYSKLNSLIKDSVEVEDAISYSQALENAKKNSVVYKGVSYSQALENFKRFLKEYYKYTDEDLKKARVELIYPLKSVKKLWYGFLNGRDESHFSYDGKKWKSIWDSSVRDSVKVEDAISYSQALENFKRFLKKYYGYTDEDLKKAKVELVKIDSPFRVLEEGWYGSSDGKVASYYSLDGKKWDEI